jgi:CelD/BcsL family acetyltransferase involved in cellulose biosynthesis
MMGADEVAVADLNATERPGAGAAHSAGPIRPAGRDDAAPAGELTTDIVTDIAGIRALTPDYERLYRVTANALPFALQDWHVTWCAHFLNRNPQVQEEPLFCVSRNHTGACVAILPLILTRRHLGPLRLATLGLIGADPGLTEIRSPLVEPGLERPTVRAVHQRLASVADWDWIQWSGLSGTLAAAMAEEMTPHWYGSSDDYILDLPPTWEELRAGLKRNLRESLRHCYNSLKREGRAFEFVVAREPDEVQQSLYRFLELHAMRSNMARGPKHPHRFTGRPLLDFLFDLCRTLAARDAVRVFQLRIGGEIVASRLAFAVGEGVYLYYSGFDPAWARYSVMTTTVVEAIKYAIANGFKTVNLSLTGEQSKRRWSPRRLEFRSALVHRDSLHARIAYRAYRVALSGNASNGAPVRLLKTLLRAHQNWN